MADVTAIDTDESSAPPAEMAEPSFVELCAGDALSAGDAEIVTLRTRVRLVVFVGAEGSGKTTVVASIYDRLSQGPFAGFQFAGSRSLVGFENICHMNRMASGRTRPSTPRTPASYEHTYYHLALAGTGSPERHQHVLLSAVSGEHFRLARSSREDCERLTFLHRADIIIVLVDGARLSVPNQRENAQAAASGILESFLDAKMVGSNCRVEFAFSKFDRVIAAGQVALDVLKKTQEKFESKFRTRVSNLTFKRIAARPEPSPSGEYLDGGLAEAFASWVVLPPPVAKETWTEAAPSNDAREFSKFGWRHFERIRRNQP